MDKLSNKQLLINLTKFVTEINARLTSLENKVEMIDKRTESYPKLYDNVDKILKEIVENRHERVFIADKLSLHDKQIAKLNSASRQH